MRKLRFGIMGCGETGIMMARHMAQSPYCEIAAVQDVVEEMAADISEKYRVPRCRTWEELFSRRDVDAVYVATPHHLHVPAIIAAAGAGKHVLVEKPIATTLADADRAIDAAGRAGVALSLAFTRRYAYGTRKVKAILDAGAIGKVIGIDFGYYGRKPDGYWTGGFTGRVKSPWRQTRAESGGGVMLMNMSHTFHVFSYLTGLDVSSVAAHMDTFKTKVEVEDYIVALMRYNNGAIGCARAASCVEGSYPASSLNCDRIIGLDGQIFISTESISFFLSKPYSGHEPGRWHTIPNQDPWGGQAELLEDFSKAAMAGKPPSITPLDGRKSLEVCLASYRSAETGQTVHLPLVE